MNYRKLRGAAALAIAATLVLSACSDSEEPATPTESSSSIPAASGLSGLTATTAEDAKILEGITFSVNDGANPTDYSNTADLTKLTAPAAVITAEGDGATLVENSIAIVEMVSYDSKGEIVASTYDQGTPQYVPISTGTISQVAVALQGQKVGATAVFAAPGTAATDTAAATEAGVIVMHVTDIRATEVVENSDAMPQVEFKDGKPSITIPEGFKASENIQAIVLKEGTGEVLNPSNTITANYAGWNLKGNQFDSSYDRGEATQFGLNQVIMGWTYGLSGQKVGSQVLLVIPENMGYGPWAEGDEDTAAKGDLLFVVDIVSKDS